MKQYSSSFSLESIEFLFRHPWLVIVPTVIIFSIGMAYLSTTSLSYECDAILSFEGAGGAALGQQFLEKSENILGTILYGENIKRIIKAGWPNISEKKDSSKYRDLAMQLRGREGIQLRRDRSDPSLLHISYISTDPEICFKVVSSIVTIIIDENKKLREEKLEAGLVFLRKQLEFYRNKLRAIDQEIARIASKLKEKSSEMTEEERELTRRILGERNLREETETTAQQVVKYDEIIADLNLELLEAQKRKELLTRRLQGDLPQQPQYISEESFEDDVYIQEYNKALAEKNLTITRLLSSGYTKAHPDTRRLQREVESLESLKEKRIAELRKTAPKKTSENREAEMRAEIEELDFQIAALQDKIKLIEGYKEKSQDTFKDPDVSFGAISEQASKLLELQNEKDITLKYYTDIRKQLEEEELKSRIEKAEVGLNINIIEAPKKPINPIPFQKISKLLMWFFIAFGAGIGLAYIADQLDKSIRTSAELRELLGVPVLATIDKIVTKKEMAAIKLKRFFIIIALIAFLIFSKIFSILFRFFG